MEEKLLKIIKLADSLAEKNTVYAVIEYTSNIRQVLQITIRDKEDFSYLERIQIDLTPNSKSYPVWDSIINLLENYIKGVENE